MVDISGLPPPPHTSPDPESFETFVEWLSALTDKGRYGVTQVQIALVAGVSPQAVTKWLKGGDIDVDKLVRLAEWTGYPYRTLRRLVDEPKLRVTVVSVPHHGVGDELTRELSELQKQLSSTNQQRLVGMAKMLLAEQKVEPGHK